MDGISLTRIARAAVLPAMIGISAAAPARGDDPVASVAGSASTRPAAKIPAPRSFGGIRSPMSYSARPAPTGPGSSRPSATAARPTRHPIASASSPALPSSWWPRPVGATAPAVKDRGWQTSPIGGATVRRSSGGRAGGEAAGRRRGGYGERRREGPTSRQPPCRRSRRPAVRPTGHAADGQRHRAGRPVDQPPDSPCTGHSTSNPDLVALRQGEPDSRRPPRPSRSPGISPPRSIPTVWVDYRPITLIPPSTFGSSSPGGGGASHHGGYYHYGQNYILFSLRQPVELGHQTTHRYHIAQAAFEQQQWNVLQAELTALVQTYRFFQTAAYRREKIPAGPASWPTSTTGSPSRSSASSRPASPRSPRPTSALARVESHGSRQVVKAARQDYLTALADLRNQIGIPESAGDRRAARRVHPAAVYPAGRRADHGRDGAGQPPRHPRRGGPDRRDRARRQPGQGGPHPHPDHRPAICDG